jgi:hypothetical protein
MISVLIAAVAASSQPAQAPAKTPPEPAKLVMSFTPKTMVENGSLQVILGERAVFHIASGGKPELDEVQKGQLADAHASGAVTETFEAPASGKLAAALDGSAEKRASFLKVWNNTDQWVSYQAIALVKKPGGAIAPVPAPVCSLPPGGLRIEAWPRPIVAVGLARFKSGPAENRPCKTTPPPAAAAAK